MSMQSVFALCHQSDIDGVGSAAMIKIRYKLQNNNIFFTDYSVSNTERSKEEILKKAGNGSFLIIADLGLNKATKRHMLGLIQGIKKKGGKAYWFDHHAWNKSGIRDVAARCDAAIVNENAKYCATEIVRNELSLDSRFCKKFAEIVHYSDFNIKPGGRDYAKRIKEYAMSIASYQQIKDYNKRNDKLRHMAEVISRQVFSDSVIRNDAADFEKVNRKRTESMLDRLIVLDNVAVGFQRGVQSTLACAAISRRSGKDISVYVNLDNMHGHIRTKRADCIKLANYFGGGGHPHAAGFAIIKGYDFSKDTDRKRFAALLDRKSAELCR